MSEPAIPSPVQPARPRARAPWIFRAGVVLLTVAFGLLLFWLLGFILGDIDAIRGPSPEEIWDEKLAPELADRRNRLQSEIAATQRTLQQRRTRQQLLSESSSGLQQTMGQLLEMQKLSLERSVPLSDDQSTAFRSSLEAFLSNQQDWQSLNDEILALTSTLDQQQESLRSVEQQILDRRKPAQEEFHRKLEKHRNWLALLKLAVLLPLLLLSSWLVLRFRGHAFFPFILAFAFALALRVVLVLHEHFPARVFKYLLIGVCLAVVARLLAWLIRAIRKPQRERLLKQYREAYERFLCPVCEFPIRRGPLRFLYWDRRSIRKLAARLPASAHSEDAEGPGYLCPSCGTALYEECPVCRASRAALLPFCEHCGASTEPALA